MTTVNIAAVIAIGILVVLAILQHHDRAKLRGVLGDARAAGRAFFTSGWRAAEECARVEYAASYEHIDHHYANPLGEGCSPTEGVRGSRGGVVLCQHDMQPDRDRDGSRIERCTKCERTVRRRREVR